MERVLKIFISYSWDNNAHKQWVLQLANYLIEKGGCDVTLDQYDLSTGGNMTHFMERSVEEADKVLLIMTPNYKVKADGRQGGVGMEYSMISQGLYTIQSGNDKFLPILRSGSITTSAPTYIQTTIYHDMSNDLLLDKSSFELLRIIHNQPKLIKPVRGNKPNFSNNEKSALQKPSDDGFAKSALKILKSKQLAKDLKGLETSERGVKMVVQSAEHIFSSIESKAAAYANQMGVALIRERYNENNSLRVQAGDYYAIADYQGYTNNQIRQISIKLRSGVDTYYNSRSFPNQTFSAILNMSSNNSYHPFFNIDKTVGWESNEIKYTTEDVVAHFFTLLLEEMSKEEN